MLCRKALPLPEAMMSLSLLDLQKGRYTDAYEGLLGVSRDDRAPIRMRADALSNAAVCQLRLHGWAKAEACAKSAVEMDPSHVDAWFNLGGAYKEQGNRLDALQAFRKVCAMRPERMDAWRYRASVSQSLFLWDEAIEAWTMMLTKGGDARAFKGRVECLVRSGKAPLADQETARFLEQNPVNDLAQYLRVLVLSDLQRFDEALPLASKLHGAPQLDLLSVWVSFHAGFVVDAEKRLEKLPESARAHILRLDVAGEDKLPEQVSAAREYLSRPRAEAPDELADLHFHLGRIADGQKQYDAAWDHYSAAHRMLAKVQPFI